MFRTAFPSFRSEDSHEGEESSASQDELLNVKEKSFVCKAPALPQQHRSNSTSSRLSCHDDQNQNHPRIASAAVSDLERSQSLHLPAPLPRLEHQQNRAPDAPFISSQILQLPPPMAKINMTATMESPPSQECQSSQSLHLPEPLQKLPRMDGDDDYARSQSLSLPAPLGKYHRAGSGAFGQSSVTSSSQSGQSDPPLLSLRVPSELRIYSSQDSFPTELSAPLPAAPPPRICDSAQQSTSMDCLTSVGNPLLREAPELAAGDEENDDIGSCCSLVTDGEPPTERFSSSPSLLLPPPIPRLIFDLNGTSNELEIMSTHDATLEKSSTKPTDVQATAIPALIIQPTMLPDDLISRGHDNEITITESIAPIVDTNSDIKEEKQPITKNVIVGSTSLLLSDLHSDREAQRTATPLIIPATAPEDDFNTKTEMRSFIIEPTAPSDEAVAEMSQRRSLFERNKDPQSGKSPQAFDASVNSSDACKVEAFSESAKKRTIDAYRRKLTSMSQLESGDEKSDPEELCAKSSRRSSGIYQPNFSSPLNARPIARGKRVVDSDEDSAASKADSPDWFAPLRSSASSATKKQTANKRPRAERLSIQPSFPEDDAESQGAASTDDELDDFSQRRLDSAPRSVMPSSSSRRIPDTSRVTRPTVFDKLLTSKITSLPKSLPKPSKQKLVKQTTTRQPSVLHFISRKPTTAPTEEEWRPCLPRKPKSSHRH